jgi:hypothetical protein
MLVNRNEPVMAEAVNSRKNEFLNNVLSEMETFNLEEQNQIIKTIYDSIKERRMCELKELKVKAEMLDKAIIELG